MSQTTGPYSGVVTPQTPAAAIDAETIQGASLSNDASAVPSATNIWTTYAVDGKITAKINDRIIDDDTMAADSASSAASQSSTKTGLALKIPLTYLDTDGTLAANSDTKIATQKATKTADAIVLSNICGQATVPITLLELQSLISYSKNITKGDFVLSWSSATVFGVSTGKVLDSTFAYKLNLASAFTKSLSAWAVGTGNGGKMSAAAMANSTTYHVYVIRKDSDSSIDVGFDVSATTPTMPSGYTYFKRIGCFRTNTSAEIIKFFQHGNMFRFDVAQNDLPITTFSSSARQTLTVSAPENTIGIFRAASSWPTTAAEHFILINAAEETDTAPTSTIFSMWIAAINDRDTVEIQVPVGAARTICYRADTNATLTLGIATIGWIDPLI